MTTNFYDPFAKARLNNDRVCALFSGKTIKIRGRSVNMKDNGNGWDIFVDGFLEKSIPYLDSTGEATDFVRNMTSAQLED